MVLGLWNVLIGVQRAVGWFFEHSAIVVVDGCLCRGQQQSLPVSEWVLLVLTPRFWIEKRENELPVVSLTVELLITLLLGYSRTWRRWTLYGLLLASYRATSFTILGIYKLLYSIDGSANTYTNNLLLLWLIRRRVGTELGCASCVFRFPLRHFDREKGTLYLST